MDHLYGKSVTNIRAFGVDDFDFTRNILGVDFSIGQFGYAVFEFDNEALYFSIGGLSTTAPPLTNLHELHVDDCIRTTFVGAILSSITSRNNVYSIQFDGLDVFRGWFVPNDGMVDRDYFEWEFPWV